MDALLENWRYSRFRNFTKTSSFLYNPRRRKRNFPVSLTKFKSKDKLFKVKRRVLKRLRLPLKYKFRFNLPKLKILLMKQKERKRVVDSIKIVAKFVRKGASSKLLLYKNSKKGASSRQIFANVVIKRPLNNNILESTAYSDNLMFQKHKPLDHKMVDSLVDNTFKRVKTKKKRKVKNRRTVGYGIRSNAVSKFQQVLAKSQHDENARRKGILINTIKKKSIRRVLRRTKKRKKGRRKVALKKKRRIIIYRRKIRNLESKKLQYNNLDFITNKLFEMKKKRHKSVRVLRQMLQKQVTDNAQNTGYEEAQDSWTSLVEENESTFSEITDKSNVKEFLMELKAVIVKPRKANKKTKKHRVTKKPVAVTPKTEKIEAITVVNKNKTIKKARSKTKVKKTNGLMYNKPLRAKRLKKLEKRRNLLLKRRIARIKKKKKADTKKHPNVFRKIKRWRKRSKYKLRYRKGKRRKMKKRDKYKKFLRLSTIRSRLRSYPLSFYSFFLKNRHPFVLPPSRKRFTLLKVLILLFLFFLGASYKYQFYYLLILRQLLSSLFSLPAHKPKFFFVRQLNTFLIKETTFRHLQVYYFRKIFQSRFLVFQGAFTAIVSSIQAFDKTTSMAVSFIGMHVRNASAPLVCNYIVHKLGQYFTIHEILRPVIFDLRSSPLLAGFRIVVAGRLTRKERAAFMVRKNGKVTLSEKDANIHYAADFKIMRFGVVGVKVWLEKKRSRPYYYKYDFISLGFLLSVLFCHIMCVRYHEIIRFRRTNHFRFRYLPIRIFIRYMKKAGPTIGKTTTQNLLVQYPQVAYNPTLYNVPLLSTTHVSQPVAYNYQPSRQMTSFYGRFHNETDFGKATTSKDGVEHLCLFDERLLTQPGFHQVVAVLTTHKKAQLNDTDITEIFKMFSKLMNNTPGIQYVATKGLLRFINHGDMKYVERIRNATPEEDAKLQKIFNFQLKPLYQRYENDILPRFFIASTHIPPDIPLDEEIFTTSRILNQIKLLKEKNNES